MTSWAEYDAALHLLTAPLLRDRTARFIREDEFDWYGLFEVSAPWSRSERMFVQAAFDLWSGGRELDGRRNVKLYDPIHTLDGRHFARLIEAMFIRDGLVRNEKDLNAVRQLLRRLDAARDQFGETWIEEPPSSATA
jgi:hypothetical protein